MSAPVTTADYRRRQVDVLDEFLGATKAVLDAVFEIGAFDALPPDPSDHRAAQNGMVLLGMLRDQVVLTEAALGKLGEGAAS